MEIFKVYNIIQEVCWCTHYLDSYFWISEVIYHITRVSHWCISKNPARSMCGNVRNASIHRWCDTSLHKFKFKGMSITTISIINDRLQRESRDSHKWKSKSRASCVLLKHVELLYMPALHNKGPQQREASATTTLWLFSVLRTTFYYGGLLFSRFSFCGYSEC